MVLHNAKENTEKKYSRQIECCGKVLFDNTSVLAYNRCQHMITHSAQYYFWFTPTSEPSMSVIVA